MVILDGLPEYFIGLPIKSVYTVPEILSSLQIGLFLPKS